MITCLLIVYSEERTSSTHALTMYRHNTTFNGKEYKVGMLSISSHFHRHLGYCRSRVLQWTPPLVLLWSPCSHFGVWRKQKSHIPELERVVQGDEESVPTHPMHLHCKQDWHWRESHSEKVQVRGGLRRPLQLRICCWWHQRGTDIQVGLRDGNQIQGRSQQRRLHEWSTRVARWMS